MLFEQFVQFLPTEGIKIVLVLFLSFLVGLEREEHKVSDSHYSFGGVRTFPLIGLIGYSIALLAGKQLLAEILGFLVVGPCEPLGYVDALAALSSLERMRKELGTHINLYRLALVMWSIVSREELEKYNAGHSVSDFEYSLVSEFLR